MTMAQQELLKCENIKKVYHTKLGMQSYTALNDINFSLCAGEFVAVMGPSGSGKTTLLNILASLDQPTSGNVLLEGQNFKDIPEKDIAQFRRDNLGFVFQDFNLLDTFSLKDNILLPLDVYKRQILLTIINTVVEIATHTAKGRRNSLESGSLIALPARIKGIIFALNPSNEMPRYVG